MSGPRTPQEALRWIRVAVESGNYLPSVHFEQRLRERRVDMHDVLYALRRCRSVREYDGRIPVYGGTCWRVFGRDLEDEMDLIIGIEAYRNVNGKQVILCTVLPPMEKGTC